MLIVHYLIIIANNGTQMWACARGHKEVALLLYQWNKMALQISNDKGCGPLDSARTNGFTDLADQIERLEQAQSAIVQTNNDISMPGNIFPECETMDGIAKFNMDLNLTRGNSFDNSSINLFLPPRSEGLSLNNNPVASSENLTRNNNNLKNSSNTGNLIGIANRLERKSFGHMLPPQLTKRSSVDSNINLCMLSSSKNSQADFWESDLKLDRFNPDGTGKLNF